MTNHFPVTSMKIINKEGFMSSRKARRVSLVVAAGLTLGLVVAACGDDDGGGGGGGGGKIAFLLPESKTARYESQDRPLFEKKVKSLCSDCEIIYSNADQDAAKQQQQAEAALTKGAKVMVLDPVDAASAGAIVARAQQSKVPVVSYDRLITDAPIDYYVQFDSRKVGKLQGESLAGKLKTDGKPKGPVVMINGAPTDNNAKLFKSGAQTVLKSSGVTIGKQYDTPDWSPDKAQQEMEQAITALGQTGFNGVLAANDGTAGGAIAAMKGAGIKPSTRPTTGQDAELPAIQRILIGEQFMTVYKPIKPLADNAAEIAVKIAKGEDVPTSLVPDKEDNGNKQVPTATHDIVAVTKDNVNDTVIKDGYWTANQVCTGPYAAACKTAGIQ
jgi:D-xylose transport system substrate-binding protein